VSTRAPAEELLRRLTGSAASTFRPEQWEAIEALVDHRRRALVVQCTGWGKSAVYFIATRLLRDRGAGPTLLISPLLALMRNQIDMAERAGIHAATINSANVDDWHAIESRVRRGEVDGRCARNRGRHRRHRTRSDSRLRGVVVPLTSR